MAKYLFEINYTQDGIKGVLKEGGTSRKNMIEKLTQNMGGSVESFYFTFGENDGYLIADYPSNVDVVALSMTVAAAGGATIKTHVLLTPEEVDQATEKTVEYRAPGQ